MTTQIKVAYINPPKTAKGPGSIKTSDGTYYKCWPTSKHKGAVLSDFSVGETYEVEYSTEEYNGKTSREVRKIVSGGGGNGTHVSAPSTVQATPQGVSPSADRSARIERQHSQEMALRVLAMIGAIPTNDKLLEWTDYFQIDIDNGPARPASEQAKEIFNVKDIEREVTEEDVNKELAEVSGW